MSEYPEFPRYGEGESVDKGCPPEDIVYDPTTGMYICRSTGEVIEESSIDMGPDWRAYTMEEKIRRQRTGAPLNVAQPDYGLLTSLSSTRDAGGRKLDARHRMEAERLRRLQAKLRTMSSVEKNIEQASKEIARIIDALGLADKKHVFEEAMKTYRLAAEKGLVRGRSLESVAAAAVYAACRMHGVPVTLDDIAKFVKGGRKEVARCYRLLVRELKLRMPVADPIRYVSKIVSLLGLSPRVELEAIKILREAKKKGLTAGKDPAGLAAAAIYIAALKLGERRTQKEIAAAAGVTEVTVRNRYKELAQKLKIELPPQ